MTIDNINLLEKQLDKKIFRIIPFDRFIEMLRLKENVFIRPSLWDDPFENLLTDSYKILKTETHVNEGNYIYAQCWSLSNENDLIWRTYSQHADGIKMQSTPRKLIESIENSQMIKKIETNPSIFYEGEDGSIHEEISSFIGKVEYLTIDKIAEFLLKRIKQYDVRSIAETLLVKREPFKNEEEIRVGIRHFFGIDDIINELLSDCFKYDFDANKIIEEVVFDPRISDYKYEGLKQQVEKFGFTGNILKSDIYRKPDIKNIMNK